MCEWAGAHTCTGHRDVTVPADHLKDKAPLKSNHQQDIKTKPEKSPASLKKKCINAILHAIACGNITEARLQIILVRYIGLDIASSVYARFTSFCV